MVRLVTVFGGSGFVGKQVVRALAKQGWRVRVAVRKPTIAYDLKPQGDVGQIQVIRADATKEADVVRALEGASACVNLVGILYQSGQTFDATLRQAATFMAQTCKAKGITDFVQVSALGANANSNSSYLAGKGKAEAAVRKAIPSAVILRPSIIFGPQDGFFTGLAGQIKMFPLMPAFGGGETKFQPVYVGDVAAAVARVLGKAEYAGQTFELGGPEVLSFKALVEYVGNEIMSPRPQIWAPYAAASFIGLAGDFQAWLKGFLPVVPAPLLTSDQVLMLQGNYTVAKGAKGLKDLGIAATAIESIVPTYLWRFRKNGQFAVTA